MTSTASRSETDDDRWFFGHINHEEASELLKNAGGEDGTFLVRESCSSPGNFVLSLISDGQPSHILIQNYWQDAFYSLITESDKIFHGLDNLIGHYCENPVAGPGGLILQKPCLGDSPPPETRLHGSSNLLHRAVTQSNLKVVSELLKSGYRKIDAKNSQGQTALHIACIKGEEEFVKLLLKNSATADVRDQDGLTPLQHACRLNHSSIASLLIREGKADVQLRSPSTGEVPLHDAATYGSLETIRVLLLNHAAAWPRSIKNRTPAMNAKTHNHLACYKFIASHRPCLPQVRLPEYYHGGITRTDAQNRLLVLGCGGGNFLLRKSSSKDGVFVLSVVAPDHNVYHFEIQKKKQMFFIDEGPYFRSLETLVDHYSYFRDGLPWHLQNPIAPSEPLDEEEFKMLYQDSNGNSFYESSISLHSDRQPMLSESQENLLSSSEASAIEEWFKPTKHEVTLPQDLLTGNHVELQLNLKESPLLTSTLKKSDSPGLLTSPDDSMMKGNKTEEVLGTIDKESLRIGPSLGVGEFGSVFKGVWTSPSGDEIEVAIKTTHDNNPINKQNFLREAQVMMNLNHPYIVKLLGVCHGPPLAMVQELAPMGSLLDFLLDHPKEIQPHFHFKLWAAQVADGMTYLEQKHFVHRDLAARNLLLNSATLVKISDFGLSRALGTNGDYYKAMQGGKWPLKWYAPESIYYGQFTTLSDVWSYGVTLWEMYTYGDQPYGELTGQEVVSYLDKQERLPRPKDCPESVYSLMLSCWASDASDRPSFKRISTIFRGSPDYVHIKPYFKKT